MNTCESIEALFAKSPYAEPQAAKRAAMGPILTALNQHHYEHCAAFARVVDGAFGGEAALKAQNLEAMPFLPVSLFKELNLSSVAKEEVFKTLRSSGTTGQVPSTVVLDKATAAYQTRALVSLMQHFLGKDRLPMVILDHPGVLRERTAFTARGAGILGMQPFGRKPFYALDEQMRLDREGLLAYLAENRGKPVFFFGFTFMVWKHFIEALGGPLPELVSGGVLIHSGGWKKLESERVSPQTFNARVREVTGVTQVLNFYGMVEQVGSVFFENPLGSLQASHFSEIIIRDPQTLEPLPIGEPGLVQVLSVLPWSYPGHSILTEDLGVLEAEDPNGTGMGGRAFRILGRVKAAELRGCSDTFEPVTTN